MQLDTSLDSDDQSDERGRSDGQWGISASGNKRLKLSAQINRDALEGAQSRSESHHGADDAPAGASNFSKLNQAVDR
eukprot:scaffold441346_cov39-Prasinocladus_malaysianus.AAC.1